MLIIFITTACHIFWCYIFVVRLDWGVAGGAWAITLTYFLDFILLYMAAFICEETRETVCIDLKTSFQGWREYMSIALPSIMQLMCKWWYFELNTLIAGFFSNSC